jgi:hypothetical protein
VNIKDIVKNNVARFSFYRAGNAFYEVDVEGTKYKFPVSLGFGNCHVIGRAQSHHAHALHTQGA